MGRKRIPSSPGSYNRRGHRKAPPGLRLVERDGFWHIHGTARIAGRSIRVRRGTGLPATADNREAAERLRLEKEHEIRNEFAFGVKPTVALAIAAGQYLNQSRKRSLGATAISHVQEITARFGKRLLSAITDREWAEFVGERHKGNSAVTRERYLNSLTAFLAWCRKRPRQYLDQIPVFDRNREARQQRSRKRRRVAELTPELLTLFLEAAPCTSRLSWSSIG